MAPFGKNQFFFSHLLFSFLFYFTHCFDLPVPQMKPSPTWRPVFTQFQSVQSTVYDRWFDCKAIYNIPSFS